MAPTTFHYFPTLPKGIREAIWATAIRPEQPGLQIFTVYDTRNETGRKRLSEYTTLGPSRLGDYALAAPLLEASDDSDSAAGSNDQDGQDGQDDSDNSGNSSDSGDSSYNSEIASWVQDNESTYLMDAGLWTACRESRVVIERWFEKNKNQDVNDNKEDIPDAQAATWFVRDGESLPIRCLTHPRTDLFFLLFFNNNTIDWKRIPGLPFSASYQRHSQYHVSHVALEFDIHGGWEAKMGQCVAKAASGELSWARNLWFINLDITRRVGGASTAGAGRDRDQYRHRFYSNGYVYTEVQAYDIDWYVDHGGLSVSDFLSCLEVEVAKYCTMRDRAMPPYRPGGHELRRIGDRPQVGVLAREQCAS